MPTTRHLTALLAAVAVAGLAAGCGDTGEDREAFPGQDRQQGSLKNTLALDDAATVERARDRIADVCRGVVGGAEADGELRQAVRALVDMRNRFPDTYFESGDVETRVRMPELLRQIAGDLRGCGQGQAAQRLEQAA
jgi:hypothetical protein